MKKFYVFSFLFGFIFSLEVYGAGSIAKGFRVGVNNIIKVQVSEGDYTAHISLEFARPLGKCDCVETIPGRQVKLYFYETPLEDFNRSNIVDKIRKLSMADHVSVSSEKIPAPRVVLTLNFSKYSVFLLLTRMNEPNVLKFDIFSRKVIDEIRRKSTTTRCACTKTFKKKTLLCSNCAAAKKKVLHIVVDAGHGGKDNGARYFGLKEKAITLDIVRRVYKILKNGGYRVSLTRNSDATLSVVDRVQLASQLKADLFISVHVNAHPVLRDVHGVDTFFLNGAPFMNSFRRNSYVFLSDKKYPNLAKNIGRLLYEKSVESKKLSSFLQAGILGRLEKVVSNTPKRLPRRACYRLLMHNEVPASIVEVGFLTNAQEAKRLTKPYYRHLLALGICDGLKKFLHHRKLLHRKDF
jgi:N-acetylmuramoyl-L-alanine amidase